MSNTNLKNKKQISGAEEHDAGYGNETVEEKHW